MAGPRQLWKTEIVVWTDYDPQKVRLERLVQEGVSGTAYISKGHSELVANPYEQDDGPPEDFFEPIRLNEVC